MIIDLEVHSVHKHFYQKTEENKYIGTDRRCYGCNREFVVGDWVSIAITDRGNLCFGDCCLDRVDPEKCVACGRNPHDTPVELCTVPCGDVLCNECVEMHVDCPKCTTERSLEAADIHHDRRVDRKVW